MQSDNIGVYKACIRDTKSLKYLSEPFLFSNINNIDPGTMPKYLSHIWGAIWRGYDPG